MSVIFIRHNLKDTNDRFCTEIIESLYQQRKIAISFTSDIIDRNGDALDPENYRHRDSNERKRGATSRTRMKAFKELPTTGAIVFADYDNRLRAGVIPDEGFGMIMGEIPRGGDRVILEDFKEIINPNDPIYSTLVPLKTIQLNKASLLRYSDYPLLLTSKPAGRLTFGEWDVIRRQLLNIWAGEDLELTASNTSPRYLELICYEYLRFYGYVDCILERIGASMQDIDIIGLKFDQGKVLAQVTHQSNIGELETKVMNLRRHGRGVSCFFFLPESADVPSGSTQDIRFITVEQVIQELLQQPRYREMIDRLINPWRYAVRATQ